MEDRISDLEAQQQRLTRVLTDLAVAIQGPLSLEIPTASRIKDFIKKPRPTVLRKVAPGIFRKEV